jgi:hypothetical protein
MVRAHLLNGESEAVYRAMNRFMEMLQARESGISAEAADRLFDYCYVVTPARITMCPGISTGSAGIRLVRRRLESASGEEIQVILRFAGCGSKGVVRAVAPCKNGHHVGR